jgi:hypothetical protein
MTRLFARLVWPGRRTTNQAVQPLMVVVFVEVARTPATAEKAVAKFRENGLAWHMTNIVIDAA